LGSLPNGNRVAAGKGDGPRCELVGGDVMRRGLSDLEKSLYGRGVGGGGNRWVECGGRVGVACR
jgi:hypothetical protein